MKKLIFTLLILLPLKGLYAQFVAGVYKLPKGAVNLTSSFIVTPAGKVTIDGILQVYGVFQFEGTAVSPFHRVDWVGTSPLTYTGIPLQVDSMTIDNPAGVTLTAPITVGQGMTFSSGLLQTSAANPLVLASGAGVISPTDGSHVNGPVQYLGTSAFTFPVGDGTYYRPVSVNLGTNSSGVTATYTRGAAPSGALSGGLQAISGYEYWTLAPTSTASGSVTLNWDVSKVAAGILTAQGVAAVKAASLSGSTWSNQGGTGVGSPSTGTVTSNSITLNSATPFALGSTNSIIAPLPLNFLGIGATMLSDGSRKVDWQVASEVQLKDYTVERSMDGQQFAAAGTVDATGSAAYTYADEAPVTGSRIFYRVRGNDLDGKATYSATTSVLAQAGAGASVIGLMPNPVADQLTVSFGPGMQGRFSMDLLGIDGRRIFHQEFETTGNQRFVVGRPGGISAGTYVARFSDSNGHVQTYKLIFK